ncbi:hypothetical protein V500_03188, partial [Pseudogymnoascus sp. VKM F-4518 (FW-2643)]
LLPKTGGTMFTSAISYTIRIIMALPNSASSAASG